MKKTSPTPEVGQLKQALADTAAAGSYAKHSAPKARVSVPTRLLRSDMLPWIGRAARLGHLSIGLVYIVLGVVTFAATLDSGVKTVGFQGVLRRMVETRAGTALLTAIGVGLLADSIWQALRAALNTDMVNPGWRGYLDRGSWLVTGLVHLGLGLVALKLTVGIDQRPNESQLRRWTQFILPMQFGGWLVVGAGIVVIIVGILFIRRAIRGDMDRWLDLSPLTRPLRLLVMALARFGVAVRGAVFIVGGALLVLAARHVNPQEVHGLGGTLRAIESQPYGRLLLACVALGFIAYGIFEVARARYRHIRVPPASR